MAGYYEKANFSQNHHNATPAYVEESECDPRENGSLVAKLQVAEELVRKMRTCACFLADRINESGQDKEVSSKDVHMSLLRFPDEIIADARAIDSALNRIEGALGV